MRAAETEGQLGPGAFQTDSDICACFFRFFYFFHTVNGICSTPRGRTERYRGHGNGGYDLAFIPTAETGEDYPTALDHFYARKYSQNTPKIDLFGTSDGNRFVLWIIRALWM